MKCCDSTKKAKGSDYWAAQHWGKLGRGFVKGRPQSVFMSNDPDVAFQFANYAAEVTGTKPVILALNIPVSKFSDFKRDEKYTRDPIGMSQAFRYESDIPPEWIEGAYDPKSGKKIENPVEDASTKRIYMVVVEDPEDDEEPAEDAQPQARAAGVIFITPDKHVLMLERSPKGDHSGEWCFPGGMVEGDEEPVETAQREAAEETGWTLPIGLFHEFNKSVSDDGLEYTTFIAEVPGILRPKTNDESTQAIWRGVDNLPEPLHPGVKELVGDMTPEDWDNLQDGLNKFINEERQEPEHSEDAELANIGHPPPSPNPKAKPTGPGTEEGTGFAGSIGAGGGAGGMDDEAEDEQPAAEHTVTIEYNGDFDMAGFIRMLKLMGGHGSSRAVKIDDDEEYEFSSTWDGDGADKILSVKIDGQELAEDCEYGQDAKLSQDEVNYGPGKPKSHCGICEYFREGPACELVRDPITTDGWCRLFTKEAKAQVNVDRTHDGPWVSCMSKDGETMYVHSTLPKTIEIKGKTVDVDEDLIHHEVPELEEIQELLAEFEKEHDRKPTTQEKKQLYLKAHHSAGTPGERQYCKDRGIDWDALQAWFRGEEARIAKLRVKNPPKDADVRPIPHHHGDLEIALDGVAEYAAALKAALQDNAKFDQLVEQIRADRSIKTSDMNELKRLILGYQTSRRGREQALKAIVDNQMLDARQRARMGNIDKHMKSWGRDAEFHEEDHPRKAGKFAKKGEGGPGATKEHKEKSEGKPTEAKPAQAGGLSERAKKVKAFLTQPEAHKVMAKATSEFLKEHSLGATEHAVHGQYMGVIHGAVGFGLEHLGASIPEALGVSIVGYAVTQMLNKFGVGPNQAMELATKGLLKVASTLLNAHKIGALKEAAIGQTEEGDAKPDLKKQDDIGASLQQMVNILKKYPAKELVKQGKKYKEQPAQDGPNNVAHAGICHLGRKGTGSDPACGNRRAHETHARAQFEQLPENIRCKRCDEIAKKWAAMKARREGAAMDQVLALDAAMVQDVA